MSLYDEPYEAFDVLEDAVETIEFHAEHLKSLYKHIHYQKNMINDLHVNVGTLARNLATLCEITTALKKQINNSA
jgi:hypothetical protein